MKYQSNGNAMEYHIQCCLDGMNSIDKDSVDLIITDPPYNKGKHFLGVSDNKTKKEFDEFNREWLTECYRILKPGHHLYFTCASDQFIYFINFGINIGFEFRHMLIWATNECRGHMLFRSPRTWHRSYEPILWFKKPGQSYGLFNNFPHSALDVLIEYSPHGNAKGEDKKVHICQKPVKLIESILLKSSKEHDLILDPFVGSGTTLLACLKNNRNGIGFEINPEYESVIKERIENFINQKGLMDFV